MTEWRRLPNSPYRSYEISFDGRVRRGRRELAGVTDRYGYRTVLLSYAGISKRFKVHRLVAEAWHGPCPDGFECAHLDSDKANNSATNLAWVSRSENQRHNVVRGAHGGGVSGERHHCAKLNLSTAEEMRRKAAAGMSVRALAREYGVSHQSAHDAIKGKTWKAKPDAQKAVSND